MKTLLKIVEALDSKDTDLAMQLAKKAITLKQTCTDKFNLFRCVANRKELIKTMTGIYHIDGRKIATDGYIMAVIKSEYPSELEGKIINKIGECIEGNYPKYQSIIHPVEKCKIFTINPSILEEMVKEAKASLKINPLTFVAITDDFNVQVEYAGLIYSFLETYKVESIDIYTITSYGGSVYRSLQVRSGDNLLLCMHIEKGNGVLIANKDLTAEK